MLKVDCGPTTSTLPSPSQGVENGLTATQRGYCGKNR
jgi:hypothetical protein